MTEHAIMRPVIGNRTRLDITQEEWTKIEAAEDGLLRVLELEEVWDVVVGNYRDFERALADVLVAGLTDGRGRRTTFDNDRLALSRMLSNLLSSIKAFQDIAAHHINAEYGEEAKDAFHARTSEQYDASFGYRVMEKLRNHSQHHGMAVTSVTYFHNIEDSHRDDGGLLVHRFKPQLGITHLRKLPRWNSIVREFDELKRTHLMRDDTIDLTPHVRDYMYRQSLLLEYVRGKFADDRPSWATLISDWSRRFREADGDDTKSSILAMELKDGTRVAEVFLNDGISEAIDDYQSQNRILNGLHRAELRS